MFKGLSNGHYPRNEVVFTVFLYDRISKPVPSQYQQGVSQDIYRHPLEAALACFYCNTFCQLHLG
jgi:hypothetical protein